MGRWTWDKQHRPGGGGGGGGGGVTEQPAHQQLFDALRHTFCQDEKNSICLPVGSQNTVSQPCTTLLMAGFSLEGCSHAQNQSSHRHQASEMLTHQLRKLRERARPGRLVRYSVHRIPVARLAPDVEHVAVRCKGKLHEVRGCVDIFSGGALQIWGLHSRRFSERPLRPVSAWHMSTVILLRIPSYKC